MNKEKQKIVPQLRFPEFENDEDWKTEPLNDVYSFKITNSFSRDKLNYEKGTVKNIHYGDIHTKFSSHFDISEENVPYINLDTSIERIDEDNYCKEGDLVIADASEDIDDIGKSIELINLNKEKLLAGLHTFLARPIDSKITIGFGGHLFKSNGIRIQIKREAQGAKVLGISKGRLANLEVYYPENEKEQQKITNCLSSLDEVISADSKKLEFLKDHKKGLLQQLFPAVGETQPQYRFPEFENDGDWKEKVLGAALDAESSQIAKNKLKFKKKGFLVYGADGLIGFIDSYAQENDYVAIVKDGSGVGNLYYCKGESSLLGTLNYLLTKDSKAYNLKWLYYLLQTINFKPFIKGANIPHIYYKDYSKLLVSFPKPKEQQKIANCLASVDDLIETVTQKIEAFKEHKKGLMQQLFPTINDDTI